MEQKALQEEVDRLNSQLYQWSEANLRIIKKLTETERENTKLKAELALVKAELVVNRMRADVAEEILSVQPQHETGE